jgi:hypothetical protein
LYFYRYKTFSCHKGRIKVEDVCKWVAEENIWIKEARSNTRCIKLHNEELHNLYSSQIIIKTIKSRKMRWAKNGAPIKEMRIVYRVLVIKPVGRNHMYDLGIHTQILLKQTLQQQGVVM